MRYWLAFYRGRGRLDDRLIRWATRSEFSHVELLVAEHLPRDGDRGDCISSSGRDGGVRAKDITFDAGKWVFVDVPWAPAAAWDVIAWQEGKKYDYPGILLSQVLNLRRHGKRRWFCSEICAHALGLAEAHTYAPGDLYRVIRERNALLAVA